MRVALKPASNNAETSQANGAKPGGESFFDILSQGTQSGVQATKAASSQAQGNSDAQAQSSEQDQKPAAQTGSSNPNAAAASSQAAKNASAPAANSQPNASAANAQASASSQNNALAAKVVTLPGLLDSLSQAASQATLGAASAAQSAQGSGKPTTAQPKNAKTDTAASKNGNAQTASVTAPQIVVPVQVQAIPDRAIGVLNPASSPQPIDPTTAVTEQTSAANAQTSGIAQTSSPRTQADVDQQTTAGAQAFEKSIADAAANAAQAGALAPAAQDSDAAKTANQNAAQSAAVDFLSAALAPDVFGSEGTTSKAAPSNAKTSVAAANFNASGATNTLAPGNGNGASANGASAAGSNAGRKIAPDANSSSQTSGDGTQRAQSDGSQTNAPAARPADADASQAIAFGTVLSPHSAAASASAGTAAPATTDGAVKHTSEANGLPAEAANTAGSPAINSARLIQTMSESEMRVGLRSSEFGDISIRTTVTQQQVQAQISVDHSELASALSGHIATTQAKIGNEFGLHASIEVSHGGASFSNDREQSPSQKDYKPFAALAQFDGASQAADTTEKLPLRPPTSMAEGSRLDIRA